MTATKDFKVAIIGGGIAGLTLAIALHTRGVPFTIYEQASMFGEIGAGVSFSPNALRAMKVCHKGIHDAFEKVCTYNVWPSKQKVWFDYLDGYDKSYKKSGYQEAAFSITNDLGQNGVHRARFLDEIIKLLPQDVARFGKRLKGIDEQSNGKLQLSFEDGSKDEVDAVIGCDGIKSRVRQLMFGANHPCARPGYTHKYAYRGLVPMQQAIEAIGEERALNSCMHMGPGSHVLTFPVNHGEILNIVAFHTNSEDWPDYNKLTRPAKQEDALRDFEGYGPNVTALLKLTKAELDCWAIFDLLDNPVPSFNKGRVCIAGDAAHATSPHHGAGAGFCLEDSAVLSSLLADERVKTSSDLEAVFQTFDDVRKTRSQWLVASSRHIGDCYEWQAEGIGSDFAKIEKDINHRNGIIANVDIVSMCNEAVKGLHEALDGYKP